MEEVPASLLQQEGSTMSMTHVIGVDPGLVHTGVVSMLFAPQQKKITVRSTAVVGLNPAIVAQAVDFTESVSQRKIIKPFVVIEGYRPRSNLNSDKRMVEGVREIQRAIPGSQVLQNMGVKKVVSRELMELLGVWKFSTVTNHQDLRSAARIAVFGMLKDPALNELVADIVSDHLQGASWDVVH